MWNAKIRDALIEQIISSHKDVLPTGENNFLSSFIKQIILIIIYLMEKK